MIPYQILARIAILACGIGRKMVVNDRLYNEHHSEVSDEEETLFHSLVKEIKHTIMRSEYS